MNEDMRALERKSRAAFDASVEAIDAATRARLARARTRALDELRPRHLSAPALWIPVGAAAAALVAAVLWRGGEDVAPPRAEIAQMTPEDLDLMAGPDFEMLQEEEGFYAWADEQISRGIG